MAVALSSSEDNATSYVFPVCNDVTFVHNRRGKRDANRAYTQSDSSGEDRERSLMSTIALPVESRNFFVPRVYLVPPFV